MNDLGEYMEKEKKHWQDQGIKSLIIVPMILEGKLNGFLGFDSVTAEIDWSDDITSLLTIVGEMFVNALKRKEIDNKLEISEKRFRTLTENSSDVIMRFDKNLRHLYVNSIIEKQVGIPAKDFIGKTHKEMNFPLKLVNIWEKALTQAFETGLPNRIEFQLPNGIWIDWLIIPEKDLNGNTATALTSARDITQLKQNENIIKQKLNFQNTISNIISKFVGNFDINEAINQSFEYLGNATNSDRIYLFLFRSNRIYMDNTHEWCAKGIEKEQPNLQNLPSDMFMWLMEKLNTNKITYINNVFDLPLFEREYLRKHDALSMLILPLRSKGQLIGFLGFDNIHGRANWDNENINLIKTSLKIFTNVLEKYLVETKLTDLYKHLGLINRRISILLELNQQNTSDTTEVFNLITSSAQAMSNAIKAYLYKYNPQEDSFYLLSHSGEITKEHEEKIKVLNTQIYPQIKHAIKTTKRHYGQVYKEYIKLLSLSEDVKYYIYFPVHKQNKLKGCLFLTFKGNENLTSQELDFYNLLIMQIAYILD